MITGFVEGLSDWVDPGAIRTLIDSVRDGFAAAPVWARIGLVVMLGFAVGTGILRFATTVVGRLVAVVLTAAIVGLLLWGSAGPDFQSKWCW